MTRIDTTPPVDPDLQKIIDDIVSDWQLDDIHEALPSNLDPSRGSTAPVGRAPSQTRWNEKLLARLRNLSNITATKELHTEVQEVLQSRIQSRREALAKFHKSSTKRKNKSRSKNPPSGAQWTILEDIGFAIKKRVTQMEREKRGLRSSSGKHFRNTNEGAEQNKIKSATLSLTLSQSRTVAPSPSSKRKTSRQAEEEDDDQEVGSEHPSKRSRNEKRNDQQSSQQRFADDRTPTEVGRLGGIVLSEDQRQTNDNPPSRVTDVANRSQRQSSLQGTQDFRSIQHWRSDIAHVANAPPPTISTLSDQAADVNFESEYPMPHNASREQRIELLETLRSRNNNFGGARVENAHAQAFRSDAQAYRRNAVAEHYARDGRDAEFVYRIQLESAGAAKSKARTEKPKDKVTSPQAPSEPSTEARFNALHQAAQHMMSDDKQARGNSRAESDE